MFNTRVACLSGVGAVLVALGVIACGGQDLDFDRDDDGIQNGLDACPDESGVAEYSGCPTAPVAPPPTPLHGTWDGKTTYAADGVPSLVLKTGMLMRPEGTALMLSVCGLAGGLVPVATSGPSSFAWQGTQDCGAVPLRSCVTKTTVTEVLGSRFLEDGRLAVDGRGVADGCATPIPFTFRFVGFAVLP
jgi:hypothetical protein